MDELKKLDEKTFLEEVFDGVPQAEISMEDLNAGFDMIAAFKKPTSLASNSDARRELKKTQFRLNKKKVGEDKII